LCCRLLRIAACTTTSVWSRLPAKLFSPELFPPKNLPPGALSTDRPTSLAIHLTLGYQKT
jgi:hypothetical protein